MNFCNIAPSFVKPGKEKHLLPGGKPVKSGGKGRIDIDPGIGGPFAPLLRALRPGLKRGAHMAHWTEQEGITGGVSHKRHYKACHGACASFLFPLINLPMPPPIWDNYGMAEKKENFHFYIHTFGCQMNFHDSEKISGVLAGKGLSEVPEEEQDRADLVVFNTCAIREKAEQKFFSELGRLKWLKKRRPGLKIAVTGCIAQQMGRELLRRAPFVDFIAGPQNIAFLGNLIGQWDFNLCAGNAKNQNPRNVLLDENPDIASTELPARRKGKPRAWVSIMYGCDNFCTYCIVPFTRGREVCRPSESILREIRQLADEGFREVTLLGQNVNSYRSDVDFPGLLAKACGVDGISRIRFVTSHPRDLSAGLIRAFGELKNLCQHIHLPLQSGSNGVLARMNRRYSFGEYMGKIEKLRRMAPGISITTDIIAGFPGETEEDYEATLYALKQVEFDGIFAFKYSPRPGTPAASFPGRLRQETAARRLSEILALQDEITLRKNRSLEGAIEEVLVEGPDFGHNPAGGKEPCPFRSTGRTRTNKIVNFSAGETGLAASLTPGSLVPVRIIRAKKHSLEGQLT